VSIAELESREIELEQPTGLWRDAWFRLRRNPGAVIGFVLVGLFVVVAIFAPLIAPSDPRAQDIGALGGRCCPGPSWDHLFGLDALGRDEFSRVVYGARFSLVIGVVSVAVGLALGLALGAFAGYLGGWADTIGPGLFQIMIAVGVTQVPVFARLLRGSILALRENDFVLAARSIGVPKRQILAAHILPNAISPVIVQGTLAMATAIIDVAGLGFLGLGPQDPSTPEWGTMLTDTTRYLQTAPHLAIIPGVAIIVSVLGFNLIGDGLREALDPKLRGRA
jgi:peptide/nickel transport system permease protein